MALTLRVLVPSSVVVASAPDSGLQMTFCTGQGAISVLPGGIGVTV